MAFDALQTAIELAAALRQPMARPKQRDPDLATQAAPGRAVAGSR
jgi:hypothetical protein